MAATGTATRLEPFQAPAMRESTAGVWKWLATFLAGVVLSQGVAWATYVRGSVTQADVEKMIQDKQAPIIVELQNIKGALNNQALDLDSVQDQLNRISIAVGADPEPTTRSRRRGSVAQ